MNPTGTIPNQQANQAGTASSAWSRGPPPATASKSSSAIHTPNQPPSPPTAEGTNGNAPVAHSRKGSIMVGGGGVDIKRGMSIPTNLAHFLGSIAFGTVDSPNPLLSSSPAAPSITGTHLADNVKAFGSIEADPSTEATARRANPAAKLDAHALFGAKPKPNGTIPGPSHERRQSMTGYTNGFPPTNPSHLRPPTQQPRSPMTAPMSNPLGPGQYPPQVQQGFRPNQMPLPYRPNGGPAPNMYMNRGMPSAQPPYMGYPNQYYVSQSTVSSLILRKTTAACTQTLSTHLNGHPSSTHKTMVRCKRNNLHLRRTCLFRLDPIRLRCNLLQHPRTGQVLARRPLRLVARQACRMRAHLRPYRRSPRLRLVP